MAAAAAVTFTQVAAVELVEPVQLIRVQVDLVFNTLPLVHFIGPAVAVVQVIQALVETAVLAAVAAVLLVLQPVA